jgi:hypothetical protein
MSGLSTVFIEGIGIALFLAEHYDPFHGPSTQDAPALTLGL